MLNQTDGSPFPTLEQIVRYLETLGWEEKLSVREKVRVFQLLAEDCEPLVLVLPSSMEFKDSVARIKDVIESIAALTDLREEEVLTEIGAPANDVVKFRLLPQRAKERADFVSVDEAYIIIAGIREALAFSAQSEATPLDAQRETLPKITNAGKTFVRKCRFAHTFKGSFGLTVETPLAISSLPLPLFEEEFMGMPGNVPFERRVLERFSRGLRTVQAATNDSNPDLIAAGFKTGLNGNVCEALFRIFEQTVLKELECRFLWSSAIQAADNEYVTSTMITRKSASFLKIAADRLKKKPQAVYVTLIGAIKRLDEAQPSTSIEGVPLNRKGFGHRVVIETKFEQQTFRVAMFLTDEQHTAACNVYRDKKLISVKGTLERRNRSSQLHIPHDLEIIEPDREPEYSKLFF